MVGGRTDGRDRRQPSDAESAKVGLDTLGRIGAYGQRRAVDRATRRERAGERGGLPGGRVGNGGGRAGRGWDLRNPLSSENPRREARRPSMRR